MTEWAFILSMIGVAYCAGLIGVLTGIGGGIVITPVLVLLFHVDIHYAMGASLISVIVTSSGAAIAFMKQGYTNVRIGMLLEVAAVIGAFIGALLVTRLPVNIIAIVLGVMLIFSAYLSLRRREEVATTRPSHPWAVSLQLEGSYPTPQGLRTYPVYRVPLAMTLLGIAGALSSLLGIGGGTLKVLAMDQAMGLPYRVSTATSNFIIGITAAVSGGVYLSLGYIDPILVFPIIIGVWGGAITGARCLAQLHTRLLRIVFSCLIFIVALEMMYKGISGAL